MISLAVACGEPASTSLEGPVACGTASCATQELCRSAPPGVDAGVPYLPGCVAVPDDCSVHDCTGLDCPACVLELCGCGGTDPNEICNWVAVADRDVGCPSQ